MAIEVPTLMTVPDCLFALRAKGAVDSVGDRITKPERWIVK